MVVSSATTAGDSRPTALDKIHPTTGDCGACHTTTPVFATDQTGTAKPANHIPTSAPCAQCHTTAGNNALYSLTGTHQGVTGCLTCHGSTVAKVGVVVWQPVQSPLVGWFLSNAVGRESPAVVALLTTIPM